MTATTLHVKLPEESKSVKSTPALGPEQYAELQSLFQEPVSSAELKQRIEELARRWGVSFEFDGA